MLWRERLPVARQQIDGIWIKPNSKFWFKCRRGRITASTRADVLQSDDISAWVKLGNELSEEMHPDFSYAEQGTFATKWGHKYEPLARSHVGKMFGAVITDPGFVLHPKYDMCGATPDAYIGDDTTVQIKCLNKDEHQLTVREGTIQRKYYSQVQYESWISGRPRILYVSYHPLEGSRGGKRCEVIEVPVDVEMHRRFEANLHVFTSHFEANHWPPVLTRVYQNGKIPITELF